MISELTEELSAGGSAKVSESRRPSCFKMSTLHCGHVPFSINHGSMHFLWYEWPHVRWRTSSPASKLSIQIAQHVSSWFCTNSEFAFKLSTRRLSRALRINFSCRFCAWIKTPLNQTGVKLKKTHRVLTVEKSEPLNIVENHPRQTDCEQH